MRGVLEALEALEALHDAGVAHPARRDTPDRRVHRQLALFAADQLGRIGDSAGRREQHVGSARLHPAWPLGHYYDAARELARLVTQWSMELSSQVRKLWYWNEVIDFEVLDRHGMIDRRDLALFRFADDPATALALALLQAGMAPMTETETPAIAHSRTP